LYSTGTRQQHPRFLERMFEGQPATPPSNARSPNANRGPDNHYMMAQALLLDAGLFSALFVSVSIPTPSGPALASSAAGASRIRERSVCVNVFVCVRERVFAQSVVRSSP
jgi:hypothetical protein